MLFNLWTFLIVFGSCQTFQGTSPEMSNIYKPSGVTNETNIVNDVSDKEINKPSKISTSTEITDSTEMKNPAEMRQTKVVSASSNIIDSKEILKPTETVTRMTSYTDMTSTTLAYPTDETETTDKTDFAEFKQAVPVIPATDVKEPEPEPEPEPKPEPVSDAICNRCVCANRTVDCFNKDLKTSFVSTDWDGLKTFKPITIDLSKNSLTKFTRISNLPTVQHLNLSNCGIADIEYASFSSLQGLVSLDLSNNQLITSSINRRIFVGIIDLNVGIVPFAKIQYLSVANNDIHSFSQDVFMFMNELTSLDLSGNPLGHMDQVTMAAITELVNLKELKLSGCQLETLPEGLFHRQRRLKRLDLSGNRFTAVPAVVGEAANLVYLDFGGNPIETLNESTVLSNLTKLKELRLSGLSKLTTIADGALGGLESLVSLHLCFNPRLTTLEDGFLMWKEEQFNHEMWPKLEELYLNNNNLTTLHSAYLSNWSRLTKMDFSNNPYLCDCSNQWIIDVLVPMIKSSEFNETASNMVCMNPKEMRGVSFVQLHNTTKTLACQGLESSKENPGPDMAILLGVIIGIFVTFPLVLVVVLLWRNGYFTKCRRKTMESSSEDEETDAF